MRHRASRSLLHRLPALAHPRTVVATLALLVAGLLTGSVVLASGPPDGTGAAIEEPGQPGASYDPPTPSATGEQSPRGSASSPRPSEPAPTPADSGSLRPSESRVSRGGEREPGGSALPEPGTTPEQQVPSPTETPTAQEPAGSSQEPTADAPQTSATTRNTNAGRWVIGVSADEEGSTFECSLDGGAYEGCGTTVSYDDLDEGTHTFSARATDGDGDTDPTPVQLTAEVEARGKE